MKLCLTFLCNFAIIEIPIQGLFEPDLVGVQIVPQGKVCSV